MKVEGDGSKSMSATKRPSADKAVSVVCERVTQCGASDNVEACSMEPEESVSMTATAPVVSRVARPLVMWCREKLNRLPL